MQQCNPVIQCALVPFRGQFVPVDQNSIHMSLYSAIAHLGIYSKNVLPEAKLMWTQMEGVIPFCLHSAVLQTFAKPCCPQGAEEVIEEDEVPILGELVCNSRDITQRG